MEAQSAVEDLQVLSYQHDNGEMFTANNLEAARGMCPVLGKMSLEEAGLLLELEAMGEEHITDLQKVTVEKSAIEKVEKVQPRTEEMKKIAKPVAEDTKVGATVELTQAALHVTFEQQTVLARNTTNGSNEIDEASRADIVESELPEKIQLVASTEAIHQQETKAITAEHYYHVQPKTEEQAVAAREYSVNPQSASAPEQAPATTTVTEHEVIETETITASIKLPSSDEEVAEPILREAKTEVIDLEMDIPKNREALEADIPDTEYGAFHTVTTDLLIDSLEQSEFEYSPEDTTAPEAAKIEPPMWHKHVELPSQLQMPELAAPVAQIETTIEQLGEAIENEEAVKTIKVSAILEQIITLPAKVELVADEDGGTLEDKLEELFVQLFEEANISYSPDVITSFVQLTKAQYLEELLEVSAAPDKKAQMPDEIGTREFLQKLQHGLTGIAHAVTNFYEIGKSIVRVYSYSLEMTAETAA